MHVHHYDDSGRLTHTEIRREPEWSDEDRGYAQALLMYEASLCHGCGHPISESHDPAHIYAVEEDVCKACQALAVVTQMKREKYAKVKQVSGKPGFWDGRKFFARKATPEEIAKRPGTPRNRRDAP